MDPAALLERITINPQIFGGKPIIRGRRSGALKTALTLAGHDVVWAGEWTTDPGDDEILAKGSSS